MPSTSRDLIDYDFYDRSFERPLTRALEVQREQRARGINAIDEVPDSTWFTNRISVRALSPDEIRNGPLDTEPPDKYLPWTVHSTKFGGTSRGLIFVDSRGMKYMLKFETPGFPEIESGSDIVANRLIWASGYNVPADSIVYFRPSDLVLAPDADVKNIFGRRTGRLDQKKLTRELAKLTHTPDGRIRAVASRWLAGQSLGGTLVEGVRDGDPNDRIPHQLRRDLRGQYPIFEWIDYVDLPTSNTLDQLVADRTDPRRHYVEHYRIDFDSTLGAMNAVKHDARLGYAYSFDWGDMTGELISLGAAPRAWRTHAAPPLRGVSPTFSIANFDPATWKPNIPYAPFVAADRFDMYWGAKLVARFTRDQIHAAVEAAQYSDPRATEYLTDTLIARQRAVVAYWFARVNPLDRFTTSATGICFDDLAIAAGVASAAETRYVLTSYDRHGRQLARGVAVGAPASGPTCVDLPLARDGDDYTIVQIDTMRPGRSRTLYVHVARAPGSGEPRVVGLLRL